MNADDDILNLNADQHDMIEEAEMEEVKETERPKEVNKSPNKYKLDQTKTNIFYSDIEMPKDFLKDVPKQFVYKFMKGTLEEMVEHIKADIMDVKPKLMILHCFGKQLYQRSNQSVIDAINQLTKLVDKDKIHQLAVSTNHFVPNRPETWDYVANFNCEMRIINIDRGLPPLTLHKCLMDRENVNYGPLWINGKMWAEYLNQEGLGENLSIAGLKKYKQFIMKAFEHQFVVKDRKPSVRYMGTPKPPPLSVTYGYENYPFMFKILIERGINNSRGVYNRAPTGQVQHRPKNATHNNQAQSDQHTPKQTRPKTWYAQNMTVTEQQGGAGRNVSLPETRKESDKKRRNSNEDHLDRAITFDELKTNYEKLKKEKDQDETYYKQKIDNLFMEIEDLKEDKDEFKKEVHRSEEDIEKLTNKIEELRDKEDCDKTKLKSALRQVEAKDEEIKLITERMEMLEKQYAFVRDLNNDLGGLMYDKKDKKKKRNH